MKRREVSRANKPIGFRRAKRPDSSTTGKATTAGAKPTYEVLAARVAELERQLHQRHELQTSGERMRESTDKLEHFTHALRESEGRYRRLFENMAEGFFLAEMIFDQEGKPRDYRFLDVNAAFESLAGLARQDVIGRTVREVLPQTEDSWIETFGRVARTGEPARTEQYSATLGRDFSTVAYSPRPGQFACLLEETTDNTRAASERERLLADAEAQRGLLDAVIENLPVGIGIAEAPSGRLLRINQQTRRIWRMGVMDAVDQRAYGRYVGFHPDGRPYTSDDWQLVRALRGELVQGEELEFVAGDGTHSFMRSNAAPVKDSNGNVVAAVVVIDDITERKRADEALRRSEDEARERLAEIESIYASAHVGLCVFDRDLHYVRINDRLAEINGLSGAAHLGKTVREVVPALADLVESVLHKVVETGQPVLGVEVSGTTAAQPGVQRFWLGHWLPLKDRAGNVIGINTVIQEITERKRMEEALRQTDRRKNEFLAMLSHELRNPLAPIRNSLYILDRATPGGAQAQRAKAIIDRQVGQLSRLVDDLLDVTRITTGKLRIDRSPLDLNDLLARTAADHRAAFDERGIDLTVRLSATPIRINGDATRIAQAVGNLLQNAVKFTPRDGRVLLGLEAETSHRSAALIRVRDNGVGIEPEVLPRLFAPFTQADCSLDRSRGGLGLGLALVKGVAEMHGGEVSAHSPGPGQGAEFVIRLPLVDEAQTLSSVSDHTPAADHSSSHVLVIEDNADAADSLCELLSLSNHVVDVAYDGPTGLKKARAFKPQVVFCDIGLPGMDGYELSKALRADEVLRSTYLVALSGYALPADVQKAHEAGFDEHLAKPPSAARIFEILAQVGSRN